MTTCYHPEHRIFFVHIPKCAGTSIGGHYNTIKQEWSNCWLNENIPGWSRQGLPNGHQPVRTIEHWTGKPIDWWNCIFVTIRNPFAQQVSQWEFWRGRGMGNAKRGYRYHPDDRFAVSCTFEQFVEDDRSNGPNAVCGRRWMFSGGVFRWWCCGPDGDIPPNVKIVRVEDLPSGVHTALDQWRPEGGWTDLPRDNYVQHKPWREHYTPRAYRAVMRKFSWSLAHYYPSVLTEVEEKLTMEVATA